MDLENREAFALVRGRIDRVSDRLDKVSHRLETVSNRLDAVSDRIDALEASMRAEFVSMRESLADARSHADVRVESLHDHIQMIAEGFAAASAKLDVRS